jgi:hypothetical protein
MRIGVLESGGGARNAAPCEYAAAMAPCAMAYT